jgi:hypothetical protein
MPDIQKEALRNLTGSVEPAYIVVHDARASAAALSNPAVAAAISAALEPPPGSVPGAPGASGDQNLPTVLLSAVEKRFCLQYNPAELQIYASSITESRQDARVDPKGASKTLLESPTGGSLELAATLWFDKMTAARSFMLEKNLMPTSASGLTNLMQIGNEESVQLEVEGFIAALRNQWTRCVTLYWADFFFTGVLTSVFAEYTMFSTSGAPVRAKIDIRIRQEAGAQADRWIQEFDTAFANDQSNLVRPEQTVGNVLNLGF